MKQGRINGKAQSVLVLLVLSLSTCLASAGLLDGARDLLNGPHIAHRYAELKEDFYPTSIAWSADGKYIASTGTNTRTINIWDVEQRRTVHSMELPVPNSSGFGSTLAWSSDGRYLASCAGFPAELSLRVWDVHTWKIVKDFNIANGVTDCSSLAFSQDSQKMLVGWLNGVFVYSTQTWQMQKRLKLQRDVPRNIEQAVFSPDGKTVAIAEHGYWNHVVENHVLFWDLADEQPGRDLIAYSQGGASVISLAFSPDGKRLSTGTMTGIGSVSRGDYVRQSVHIWNVVDNALLGAPLDGLDFGKVYALLYTSDGKYLIAGHEEDNGTIHILNAQTLQIADTVHAPGQIIGIAVHPTTGLFAVSAGRSIVVWSLTASK